MGDFVVHLWVILWVDSKAPKLVDLEAWKLVDLEARFVRQKPSFVSLESSHCQKNHQECN